MPKHIFPHTEVELDSNPAFPDGHKAYRPMVEVELINGSKSVCCLAIVDSGSDYCVFPESFLPKLGLNKETLPSGVGSGVGGQSDIHFKKLQLKIEKIGNLFIYTGFDNNRNEWGIGLLGRCGFFDLFHVAFDQHKREFYIEG